MGLQLVPDYPLAARSSLLETSELADPDPALAADYRCDDITGETLDPDFQRNRRIHCCWSIRHRGAG